MASANIASTLRRSLLIKVISKPAPSREDVNSVIELTASKVVEALQAQSMTLYLVEGNDIAFKQVYYSPTLWAKDPSLEKKLQETAAKLLTMKLPKGTGVVGKVIETGEPAFFRNTESQAPFMSSMAKSTGFEVRSMLTVPLKTNIVIGAIQLLNKEMEAGTEGEFVEKDLALLQEVAEYSASLIQRMLDPKFQLSNEDPAKFVAKLTDLPLVTKVEDVECDEALIQAVGDALIRREGIFPHKVNGARRVRAHVEPARLRETRGLPAGDRLHDRRGARRATFADRAADQEILQGLQGRPGKRRGHRLGGRGHQRRLQRRHRDGRDERRRPRERGLGADHSANEPHHRGCLHLRCVGYSHRAYGKGSLIRYRIDGLCVEKLRLPKQATNSLITRLKIMCNLDISERRLPQDGRIVFKRYTKKNIDIDLRVATGPMKDGEKVVMRILDKQKSTLPLPQLGFSDENLARYRECIRQPYGMILHCGPTGSGKSMTLYSALGEVNTPDVNIQTAEDPIEYTLAGINQMQMSRAIGLTFARALRCYLRMDPDIILVGEIRDEETAGIAVEAALTGHLLVSTLHTNDAPSTVARIGEMGVEPFNISASLVCVCAQRLLRRVCKSCKQPYEPKDREKEIITKAIEWSGQIFKANPQGCPTCNGTGYKGRVGIHELMVNSEELTEGINKEVEVAQLKRIAMKNGMKTLHQDSMLKVKMGLTTVEEALANVPPDLIL